MSGPAWQKRWLCVGAICVAAGLTYGQVVTFSFVTEDDQKLLVENPTVTHWGSAPLSDRLLTPEFTYAIPVTVASWALDWALFGGAAWGLHLGNLLLAAACALALFFAARRLTGALPALAGAGLLLLHPLAAEPVSFVTQRKDLLATLFALLALERTLAAARSRHRTAPLTWALGLALLAGLSKPTALVVGPALVGVYWLTAKPPAWSGRARWSAAGLAALAPALLALNYGVQRLNPGTLDTAPAGAAERLALMAHTLTHYAQSLLLPLSLSPKVPRPAFTFTAESAGAAVAVVAGSVALGAWLQARQHRRGLAALLWCAAAYVPVANGLPVRRYVADSYLFLLLAGLGLGLALALERAIGRGDAQTLRRRRLVSLGVAGVLLLGLGVIAHRQAGVWRDEGALFGYLYRLYPNQSQAVAQYVKHLRRTGRHQRAQAVHRDFLQRALRRRPKDLAARHRLMRLHLSSGYPDQARALLERAPPALRTRVGYWEAWLEYAMRRRDYRLARRAVLEILRRDPRSPRRRLLPELERRIPLTPRPPPRRAR